MQRKLYLHIGTHKTGSTSIQHFLKDNQDLLIKNNYYYPMEGGYYLPPEASQSLLAHAVLEKRPNYIGNVLLDKVSFVKELKEHISNNNCENVVISSEHFSHATTVEEIRNIIEIFSSLFSRIKIIIYLRRQDLRSESSYIQNVKTGNTVTTFDEFIQTKNWDYHEMLSLWANVIGDENIVVRPFEQSQFSGGSLIKDFLIHIDYPLGEISTESNYKKNISPPIEYIEFIRILGYKLPSYGARRQLYSIINKLPLNIDQTKYTFFSLESRRLYLDGFRESNNKVAEEFLKPKRKTLFSESEEASLPTFLGLSDDRLKEIFRELVLHLVRSNIQMQKKLFRKK